jgi:hypothetical protein
LRVLDRRIRILSVDGWLEHGIVLALTLLKKLQLHLSFSDHVLRLILEKLVETSWRLLPRGLFFKVSLRQLAGDSFRRLSIRVKSTLFKLLLFFGIGLSLLLPLEVLILLLVESMMYPGGSSGRLISTGVHVSAGLSVLTFHAGRKIFLAVHPSPRPRCSVII